MSEEDYGNDDFLADFDVDAAVANAAHTPKNNNSNLNDNNIPSYQEQAPRQTERQSFEPRSKFSIGSETNPFDHDAVVALTVPSRQPSTLSMPASPYNSRKRQQVANTSLATSKSLSSSSPNKKQVISASSNNVNNNKNDNNLKKESINETTTFELTQTLQDYFGHNTYRPGQLSIIQSIIEGQDAAVFWSTGAGKSICYQIPPLHMNQIAIVISPLISLMEDQVSKLNGLALGGEHAHTDGNDIAVFLGSAQTDPMAQQRALNGEYKVVYCTPEKLTFAGGSFLNDLGSMHRRGQQHKSASSGGGNHNGICLVAVDESHCVRYACLFSLLCWFILNFIFILLIPHIHIPLSRLHVLF